MSAFLKGRCLRLARSKANVPRTVCETGNGVLSCAVLRRLRLPLQADARCYSDISASKGLRLKAASDLDRAICRVGRVSAVGLTRRYQHSQAQEQVSEIDHAPAINTYPEWIKPQDTLPRRHIGPSDEEIAVMVKSLDQPSLEAFIRQTIPDAIRASKEFSIPSEQTPETEMLDELTKAGKANSAAEVDTYIGMGYHPTITPGVIKRNVLENPGWYTSYTPYQPEISQGIPLCTFSDCRPSREFIELPNCHY